MLVTRYLARESSNQGRVLQDLLDTHLAAGIERWPWKNHGVAGNWKRTPGRRDSCWKSWIMMFKIHPCLIWALSKVSLNVPMAPYQRKISVIWDEIRWVSWLQHHRGLQIIHGNLSKRQPNEKQFQGCQCRRIFSHNFPKVTHELWTSTSKKTRRKAKITVQGNDMMPHRFWSKRIAMRCVFQRRCSSTLFRQALLQTLETPWRPAPHLLRTCGLTSPSVEGRGNLCHGV